MSDVLAQAIVGVAVAVSASYCVWRLGPDSLRAWMRQRLFRGRPVSSVSRGNCGACNGCTLAAHVSQPDGSVRPRGGRR